MHLTVLRARIVAHSVAVALTAVGVLIVAAVFATPAAAQAASLVGAYEGGQMEMAAGLELGADRRFRYALSYGALDEQAAGAWTVSGNQVLLTSDPVVAPRFVVVSHGRGSDGVLQVALDLPNGISRQYFDAVITRANGRTERKQLTDTGLALRFTSADAPTSIRLLLPVFSLAGDPTPLDARSGYSVRFRFEPNDIGKVAFQATPLTIVNGELLLNRHGRAIRFRRSPS